MGVVFASAARAPLTSLASVVELTGDFTLTLPVMLAVAIATLTSRAVSYGTIYTTKLLRRGIDIDHPPPPAGDPFEELTAAAMRPFRPPLPALAASSPGSFPDVSPVSLPGPVTGHRTPQVLFAGESLTQALRQLSRYGPDGLPVLAADGQHLEGWLTTQNVLRAVQRQVSSAPAATARAELAAEWALPSPEAALHEPPDPLAGYQLLEITIPAGSPDGQTLGATPWPAGSIPVSVLTNGTLRDPDPAITLAPGDRINLLTPLPRHPRVP
jgi:CIC family chloride channel protein